MRAAATAADTCCCSMQPDCHLSPAKIALNHSSCSHWSLWCLANHFHTCTQGLSSMLLYGITSKMWLSTSLLCVVMSSVEILHFGGNFTFSDLSLWNICTCHDEWIQFRELWCQRWQFDSCPVVFKFVILLKYGTFWLRAWICYGSQGLHDRVCEWDTRMVQWILWCYSHNTFPEEKSKRGYGPVSVQWEYTFYPYQIQRFAFHLFKFHLFYSVLFGKL